METEVSLEYPELDLPLLRKAVEWVQEQAKRPSGEREWIQGAWRVSGLECGTAYCVAGYVANICGSQWMGDEYLAPEPGDPLGPCLPDETEVTRVSDRAQKLLGLTRFEANGLFYAENGVEAILLIARDIAADRGEELGL